MLKGDKPSGAEIAKHLEGVFAALPPTVKRVYWRADSGFYCWDAVRTYERLQCHFLISARKTSRLLDELRAARWTGSPKTGAEGR